jgi:hypothetical protein
LLFLAELVGLDFLVIAKRIDDCELATVPDELEVVAPDRIEGVRWA